jgi:hypothetical protein
MAIENHPESSLVSLAANGLLMQIDLASGGRIVAFQRDGEELLTPRSVHPDNYGSTLWDSPQASWDWPPRAALDNAPYQRLDHADALLIQSDIDPSGLRFTKRFRANAQAQRIEIDYRIYNEGASAIRVAPWEVTRTPGGLSFFPYQDAEGLPPTALHPLVKHDGICWYPFAPAVLEQGRKLFAAGTEGWLAHVNNQQRLLFVKTFPVTGTSEIPPTQGAIEIWGHDRALYIELENHGPYVELAPQQQLSYRVNWYLEALPAQLRVGVGEAALVAQARAIAARA